MQRLTWITGALFIVAVPLLLVCASVAWAVNNPGVYHRGFAKYQIADYTGITVKDLRQVGADLRRYFNSPEEPLAVRTRVFGREQELFNRQEVQHMRDVKRLFWGVYAVGTAAGLCLAALIALGLRRNRGDYLPRLSALSLRGGLLTLAIVLVVGLFSLLGFSTLFQWFHMVSFANDLWQLDPATDYLVVLFPLGFWFDATLQVAALTTAGALAVALSAATCLLYLRRKAQHAPKGPNTPTV